jgi:hypothetical protein
MGSTETGPEQGTGHQGSSPSGIDQGSKLLGEGGPVERDSTAVDSNPSGRSGRLKERRGKLIFSLGCSGRYCAKRAHFYAACSDWTTLISLIGGTAVFADVIGDYPPASAVGAVLIVLTSLGSLIFKWTDKARFWAIQRSKYGKLEERFIRIGAAMSEAEFNELKADMTVLEADEKEGATRNALGVICHNEECNARNLHSDKIRLFCYQRWFAHIADLPPVRWS